MEEQRGWKDELEQPHGQHDQKHAQKERKEQQENGQEKEEDVEWEGLRPGSRVHGSRPAEH